MKRIVRCPRCNGTGKLESVHNSWISNLIYKPKACALCYGYGNIEHLQKRCLICGQFCGDNKFHEHINVIEV